MDLSAPSAPDSEGGAGGEFDLPDPEQNAELQRLLSTLAARPGNRAALQQLEEFLTSVLLQANLLADQGRLEEMNRLLRVVRNVNPRKPGLAQASQRYRELKNVGDWLASASAALDAGNIVEPSGRSALHFLEQVLAVDPDNALAVAGMSSVRNSLLERAVAAARELDFEAAEEWLYEAALLDGSEQDVERVRREVAGYRLSQADRIEQDVIAAIATGRFDYAEFILIDLVALLGNDDRVKNLRDRLRQARVYGQYSPGQVIQDPFLGASGTAPALVVIRAGSFLMGSPEDEHGRAENEGPQHRVTLQTGYGLGLQEVTVGQFRAFIEATGYQTTADVDGDSRVYDEASGRITQRPNINWTHDYLGNRAADNLPVIHVSWHDAQAYAAWLADQTGRAYRLPTEAEFEFALRGGTVTRYWWGDDRPDQPVENLTGLEDESPGGRHWSTGFRRYDDGFWGPAPGATFPPNPMGLHDMAGNVSEWVEDCWHQTYVQAPADGSAWVNPGCERRVLRGGYWASAPDQARSSSRLSASSLLHGPQIGFRVARDL
ncbi:MAG: formylglycine-generating enzyme family protein [Xanthomonadales bacterium]|nr:formylglycine-generating enzyme family protein [Xanthomonadales bacterium]NNE04570.1 formylglycine-generating enzyme family protein [Xanthomonadales bacterium]